LPALRRPKTPGRELTVHGAIENNLKNVDVTFPLGLFVAVTGVSGSGKSTLVNDILYTALAKQIYNARTVPGRHRKISGAEHVDKVIHVDQSPIGRTPRSNPATYTGVFDHVRK
ncbi:MAG: excinuclease ABC subunit A, partial [Actinomycetota bacterium]|nr:excinuclease ABC subunit A [Actinomycetota bacterium]